MAEIPTWLLTMVRSEPNSPTLAPAIFSKAVLPEAALSGLAGRFVSLACQDSEAPPAAVLATFLARFGVEVGPVSHVLIGEAHHPARLFVVIVGASSKSRKGTSGQLVQRLFNFPPSGEHESARLAPGPLSTGEGLIFAVRDPVEQWNPDKKGGGQFIVVDPGESNKRLFVLDEELAAALQCSRREGNTLSTIIRTLWDSGNVEPLTKTNKIKTTGAHIGLVTHITLLELTRLLDETQAFNGFANRFLWVCVHREKLVPLPRAMPEEKLLELQQEVYAALAFSRELKQVELSSEARALWEQEYPVLAQEHPGLAGSVINRGEAQVMRLALIYALLDQSALINDNHLRSALALWSYGKRSALYIFEGRESNPLAQRILDVLAKGPCSTTDLYKALGNSINKRSLNAALEELRASGGIVIWQESNSSKPKTVYALAEFAEFSEESPAPPGLPQENSENSENSLTEQKASLWSGPAEMVI